MKDEPLLGEVTRRRRNRRTYNILTLHWPLYQVLYFFIFKDFFLTWTIFKVFMNPLQYCLCFRFGFFGREAGGILAH